ncbi:O-antigen polymerase [Vibrio sp. Vb2131]|uniref:O-antigen polymerase n=1 Tax=Vibrio sp. Vb2131 TaxID=3074649 RepID=UPI0029656092|nr:O-antigen polymerase [Vibrio sp. Vb2131]MDW1886839.1 O-antigen polymerase [Vibrio sp. Vb2131]
MAKKSISSGLVVLSVIPLGLYLGRMIVFHLYGLSDLVSTNVLWVSFFDALLSSLVFLVFFSRNDVNFLQKSWRTKLGSFYRSSILLCVQLLFLVVTLSQSGSFISLIIAGFSRQELVDTLGQTPLILSVAAKFFVATVVLVCISSTNKLVRFLAVIGFVLVTIVFTSRANILTVLIFVLIITFVDFNRRQFFRLFIFSVVMVSIALFVTIFVQNRALESNFMGPMKPLEDYFLYGGYSFYLAEFAINFAYDNDKYLFPFFGYVGEFFGREFLLIDKSSLVDSEFVLKFRVFYSDYRQHFANVIYPWWAWFYGAYGFLGLIFKSIFVYSLLAISFWLKSFPLVFVMIYWGLFTTALSFPIISLDGFFTLFFVVFIDLVARVKITKG